MSDRAVLFALAWKSLLNRRLTAGLTVASVAVSVMLLVAVDRIRSETKASFVNTISGVDLVVGARGGPLNLLLYAVFRVGDATSNISWASYQRIAARPEVAWSVPLSLGDAHRGYRVLGTNGDYFVHYRYGRDRALAFAIGKPFASAREAVLGAEVAAALGYAVGDEIVVSHGIGEVSFVHHDDAPFTVAGILAYTGTPVDRTVHVSLAGIEAMHAEPGGRDHDHDDHREDEARHGDDERHGDDDHDERHGDGDHDEGHGDGEHDERHGGSEHDEGHGNGEHDERHGGSEHDEDHGNGEHDERRREGEHDHVDAAVEAVPGAITACLVGLRSRPLALQLQRFVNEYEAEPLMAIVPGATLQQLWDLVGVAETALMAVAVLVVVAGLIGMTTTLLAGLAERRREMAVLRAVGAGRGWVFALLIVESAMLAAAAAVVGAAAAHGAMFAGRAALEDRFGLALAGGTPDTFDLAVVVGVTLAGVLAAAFPAWRAYRYSLADGLAVRV